jgi:hypothetical protein
MTGIPVTGGYVIVKDGPVPETQLEATGYWKAVEMVLDPLRLE